MVSLIIKHRLSDEQQIDPQRVITDVGLDEISLKKRHKLYATILTDLTDPNRLQILAVAPGRDQAAAAGCLNRLNEQQRAQIVNHRTDMSPAYTAAGEALLPNSQQVVDRFHVAQKLGKVVDRVRKKDTCLQKEPVDKATQTIPFPPLDVYPLPGPSALVAGDLRRQRPLHFERMPAIDPLVRTRKPVRRPAHPIPSPQPPCRLLPWNPSL